jgi:hypothetical protein
MSAILDISGLLELSLTNHFSTRRRAMSVTTTANPVSGAVLQALTDYDIHHSGNPESPEGLELPNPPPTSRLQPANNPDSWDVEHRRVPSYRPVEPERLGPERPAGANAVEGTFIFVMLRGVGLIAVSHFGGCVRLCKSKTTVCSLVF